MIYAYDRSLRKVHIDETISREEYTCPGCGVKLITRKGDIRMHHFAHPGGHRCTETWESKRHDTEWHTNWQCSYPRENQEVYLNLGEVRHRADIIIGKTVIEFQHSLLNKEDFDERNNFYSNLGYRVIWLFDVSSLYGSSINEYREDETGIKFTWQNPTKGKAFNAYDVKAGRIELFLQMKDEEENSIVKVEDVSWMGFEEFTTSKWMSKSEFLEYTGYKQNKCQLPIGDNDGINQDYDRFKLKYNISLNKQQERALISLEGSVMLLAVPGSGKTTVLVDRIGYMVKEKNINPRSILVLTFSKTAVDEIKERCSEEFGIKDGVNIKTINSLCLEIYNHYCKTQNKVARKTINDKERKSILRKVFKEYHDRRYPSQSELSELETAISYIKNMLIDIDNQQEEYVINNLDKMYKAYMNELDELCKMDYDDQLKAAYWILTDSKADEYFKAWNNIYKYICVDEAQDTSKIQHCIIKRLAEGNNIFMVGDEDQSIYGFRGAYPQALLNFRADYKNPFIIRMETNYRSTEQIVKVAQNFINQNRGRYNKAMTSAAGAGSEVNIINVKTRKEQFDVLLEAARNCTKKTGFLYRDNESAIALVNLLLENNIKFYIGEAKMNFFNLKVVKDALDYFRLIKNNNDTSAFKNLGYKCSIGLSQKVVNEIVEESKESGKSVKQILSGTSYNNERIEQFLSDLADLKNANPSDIIDAFKYVIYSEYAIFSNVNTAPLEVMRIISHGKNDIDEFLGTIIKLQNFYGREDCKSDSNVILSTIHASKGEEYEAVYLFDIYAGRLPTARKNVLHRSKDNLNEEQEERRLFYVGLTRAKRELNIIRIEGKDSPFIDEMFSDEPLYKKYNCNGDEEVVNFKKFQKKIVPETVIPDEFPRRKLTCIVCGRTGSEDDFWTYGGNYGKDKGKCNNCE